MCGVPRLFFETTAGEPPPPGFGGDTAVLVYFVSFAFATRYGSQHPFSRFALIMRTLHKVNMTPLTTFADRDIEEEADARELERVWQDAAPLADTLGRVIGALESGEGESSAITSEWPDLVPRLQDLKRMADWAAGRGARVRLSFEL
jgi:hypothetical protein